MTYQVTVKDFKKAILNMKSHIALVVCSESNPRMAAYVKVLMKDDGTVYTNCGYQVDNLNTNFGDNYPIDCLVREFNKAMLDYSERQY